MNETPYLRRRGERWFFELGKKRAEKAGWRRETPPRLGAHLSSIPLGRASTREEIAKIRASAQKLYAQYLEDAGLVPQAPVAGTVEGWPPDSLGAFYLVWRRRGVEWQQKKARTREDYDRAWKHIAPAFGADGLHTITPDRFAAVQRRWERDLSVHERYRTVKCARAIFNAAVKRGLIERSPATLLANPMPKGRWRHFSAAEIYLYVATAWEKNKVGLALALWTAWETAMSPVDVRTLCRAMLRRDLHGLYIARGRSKIERAEVLAALSTDLAAAIEAYVEDLAESGLELAPQAPIFRKKRGTHYRDHIDLAHDFARLRATVMKGDRRSFVDIRRSANLEMRLGDASPEERAKILANTLDKSRFLDATYSPSTVALARRMATKRAEARALLSGANDGESKRAG